MKPLLLMIATVFVAVINTASVNAEVVDIPVMCGPIEDQIAVIRDEYKETMIWMSEGRSAGNGAPLYTSLWVNPETQTWTILVANTGNGTSCVFATGEGYSMSAPGKAI